MGRRHWCGLLLVLLLHDEVAYSLAPRVSLSRAFQRRDCLPQQRGRTCATGQQPRRRTQRCSRCDRMVMSASSMSPPAKAVLSSLLTASVVLTGVMPGLEVESPRPSGRNTVTQVVASAGVPNAAASAFNTEQAAIAETWRTVDRLYVDRTFGGQDWFGLRQQNIKDAAKGMTESDLNSALSKMLASLGDRYTRYLPPAKYATIVQSSSGDVAGVGVSLSVDGGRDLPLIVGVESGTPAADAGLQAGDLLLQISGDECRGLAPDDAAALLRGTENTKVGIVAERPASGGAAGEKLDLIVTRRKFKVEGVIPREATVNGRKIGIVRIKSFSSNTAGDVKAAVERFKSSGVSRIVVDLRGNVGGLLPGGIDTAGLFLDSGKDVVFIIRKNGSVEGRTTLEAGPQAQGLPLTLLVDKGTASAAEVFAAAVRENDRAMLVGERTFGKGVIQTVEPLTNGGGVAVTVARYETPLHHNINKVGIPVDREIECPASRDAAECDI
ncbi:unnamed protein product [Ectocarpus sp. 12 AP-2014]